MTSQPDRAWPAGWQVMWMAVAGALAMFLAWLALGQGRAGLAHLAALHAVERTPLVAVADLLPGPVSLAGHAAAVPGTAPLPQPDAVYLGLTREVRRDAGRAWQYLWEVVEHREWRPPFRLADRSAGVLVLPDGAIIHPTRVRRIPPDGLAFAHGRNGERSTVTAIAVRDWLFVHGWAEEQADGWRVRFDHPGLAGGGAVSALDEAGHRQALAEAGAQAIWAAVAWAGGGLAFLALAAGRRHPAAALAPVTLGGAVVLVALAGVAAVAAVRPAVEQHAARAEATAGAVTAMLAPHGVGWTAGDWPGLAALLAADAPPPAGLSPEAVERLRRLLANQARATARLRALWDGWPEGLVAWGMGETPPPAISLTFAPPRMTLNSQTMGGPPFVIGEDEAPPRTRLAAGSGLPVALGLALAALAGGLLCGWLALGRRVLASPLGVMVLAAAHAVVSGAVLALVLIGGGVPFGPGALLLTALAGPLALLLGRLCGGGGGGQGRVQA